MTETTTAVAAFAKTIRPGSVPGDYDGAHHRDVFCRIEWDGSRLSISGVIGPKPNGDAWGSCGQIDGDFAHRNPDDDDARTTSPYRADDMRFADGWDAERWYDFLEAWGRWHQNDMSPACAHQRAAGWDKRPIDPDKPTTAYGKHFPGQRSDSWNLLGWVRPDQHPDGLLTAPCPECGYGYGTAWVREDVPGYVLAFLRDLPETDKAPAWV